MILMCREFFVCNVLWGTLTDKSNPFLPQNAADPRLFYFPGYFRADGSYDYQSTFMNKKKPYVEAIIGVHNIFKVFHVEYVRRLTYTERPDSKKWGFRFMFRVTFCSVRDTGLPASLPARRLWMCEPKPARCTQGGHMKISLFSPADMCRCFFFSTFAGKIKPSYAEKLSHRRVPGQSQDH